jgi:hypothetical protein
LGETESPVPADPKSGLHICFDAPTRASVDAFYAAALGAGGRDSGKPGLRSDYGPDYYAAFVIDLLRQPAKVRRQAVQRRNVVCFEAAAAACFRVRGAQEIGDDIPTPSRQRERRRRCLRRKASARRRRAHLSACCVRIEHPSP